MKSIVEQLGDEVLSAIFILAVVAVIITLAITSTVRDIRIHESQVRAICLLLSEDSEEVRWENGECMIRTNEGWVNIAGE